MTRHHSPSQLCTVARYLQLPNLASENVGISSLFQISIYTHLLFCQSERMFRPFKLQQLVHQNPVHLPQESLQPKFPRQCQFMSVPIAITLPLSHTIQFHSNKLCAILMQKRAQLLLFRLTLSIQS